MSDQFDFSRGPGVPGSAQWNEYFRRLSERMQTLPGRISQERNNSAQNGKKRSSSGGGDGPSSKFGKFGCSSSASIQFGTLGGAHLSAMGGMAGFASAMQGSSQSSSGARARAGAGGSVSFSRSSSFSSASSSSTFNIQGRSTIRGIHVNGRWTATINDYVVRVNTSRPVSIDIIDGRIFIRYLQYANDREWATRDMSPTTATGNWELRTDGIVITINPPEAHLLDSFRMTKKEPGKLEIQMPYYY